jgi:hypothetical protein
MVKFGLMELVLKGRASFKEIFRYSEACVYQCEKSSQIILEFQNDTIFFKIPCFLAFRRQVEKIDLHKMLLDPARSSDIEIIRPCGCDKIFVLTPSEIAELKNLMEGTKVMLELSRILSQSLCATCN